jgi:Zn-dependent protease with chaperone function
LALSLAVRLLAPALIRFGGRLRSHSAAQLLLLIRLLPPISALFVAIWTAPTYVWNERSAHAERVGIPCWGSALLGILVLVIPQVRGWISMSKTLSYLRHCQRAGRVLRLPGERTAALVVEGGFPFFALVGIREPRLVISAPVVSALSATELAAALRHERAHHFAMDNLKRMVVLLSPDPLPFYRGLRVLEEAWSRFTERAADDRAAAGDSGRSLSLAAALVRMAQLGVSRGAPAAMTPLLTQDQDLITRVNRLVDGAAPRWRPSRYVRRLWVCCFAACLGFTSLLAAQPGSLRAWGNVIESLHRAGLSRTGHGKGRHRNHRAVPQPQPNDAVQHGV